MYYKTSLPLLIVTSTHAIPPKFSENNLDSLSFNLETTKSPSFFIINIQCVLLVLTIETLRPLKL